MTVKNYVLDINKTSLQYPSIVLRQDDYNIYTVNISVTDNGTPVNLGSYTLNFLGITPAGAKIIDSKNFITTPADLAVGKFSYRFPKEAAGSKGIYDVAYFRLKTTSGATSTIDLNLRVLGGIDLTADEVKDYITVDDILLDTLVAEVFKKVDAKVDKHLATVKKGDKGEKGDPGKDAEMPVVGGRNLLLGTADWSGGSTRWDQRATSKSVTYRGMIVATTASAWKSPVYLVKNAGILQVGKTYTFSTYVRNTSDTDTEVAGYYDDAIVQPRPISQPLPAHTDWTRVSRTFKVTKDPTTSTQGIRWESRKEVTNGQIQFAGYKLEEGNIATDWTPAPEDVPSNDAQLVHKTGNETIAGDKTFTGNNKFTSSIDGALRTREATFTDFAQVAKDMDTYAGNWHIQNSVIANGPKNSMTWTVVSVIQGNGPKTGLIITLSYLENIIYYTSVNGGTIQGWNKLPKDSTVVHNSGNETITGDKTFTSNTTLAQTTILAGNYGLRVTPSGFQKTTDGKTWVSANI